MDWDWQDGAEGKQLGAEGREVRGAVEGEVVFLAVPVCCSLRNRCEQSVLKEESGDLRE